MLAAAFHTMWLILSGNELNIGHNLCGMDLRWGDNKMHLLYFTTTEWGRHVRQRMFVIMPIGGESGGIQRNKENAAALVAAVVDIHEQHI